MGSSSARLPAAASRGLLLLLSLTLSWSVISGQHSQTQPTGFAHTHIPLTSSQQQVTSSGQGGAGAAPHVRVLKELKVEQGGVQRVEGVESVESEERGESVEMELLGSALGSPGVEGTVWVSPTVDGATDGINSAINLRSNSNSNSNGNSVSDSSLYTLTGSKQQPTIILTGDDHSLVNSNNDGGGSTELRKPAHKGYPSMAFNGRFQKFESAFDYAWWCNNTWRCYENPDRSIQLNTFWTDKVSGFGSRQVFEYGTFSVDMKLPLGNSEGMYHTFYLIQMPQIYPNDDPRHAEIDIEFYGSKDYRRTWIATNIITNGYERLEHHFLPFDPTAKFHQYTIQWSPSEIIFFVDNSPIRITKRKKGGPWPAKPLQLIGTTWANSKNVVWTDGPISVKYRNVRYRACAMWTYKGPFPACRKQAANKKYTWNKKLTAKQWNAMHAYRKKYLINAWDWGKWAKPARQLFKRFKNK